MSGRVPRHPLRDVGPVCTILRLLGDRAACPLGQVAVHIDERLDPPKEDEGDPRVYAATLVLADGSTAPYALKSMPLDDATWALCHTWEEDDREWSAERAWRRPLRGADAACVSAVVDDFAMRRDGRRVYPLHWMLGAAPHGSPQPLVAAASEWFVEAAVGELLRRAAAAEAARAAGPPSGLGQHLLTTRAAWETRDRSYLLMDRASTTLTAAARRLPLRALRSVVLQVLVGLAAGQAAVGLKHHDLHTRNVFADSLGAWDAATQGPCPVDADAEAWEYEVQPPLHRQRDPRASASSPEDATPPLRVRIENRGVLARLADFGLAGAGVGDVRVQRADYGTMVDIVKAPEDWGPWDGALAGCEAYDAVMLLHGLRIDLLRGVQSAQRHEARRAARREARSHAAEQTEQQPRRARSAPAARSSRSMRRLPLSAWRTELAERQRCLAWLSAVLASIAALQVSCGHELHFTSRERPRAEGQGGASPYDMLHIVLAAH